MRWLACASSPAVKLKMQLGQTGSAVNVLRYVDDVNGSVGAVAGVVDDRGTVMGLMPHPEHAVDPLLGPVGGRPLLQGLITAAHAHALALV